MQSPRAVLSPRLIVMASEGASGTCDWARHVDVVLRPDRPFYSCDDFPPAHSLLLTVDWVAASRGQSNCENRSLGKWNRGRWRRSDRGISAVVGL
ncbi:hypothetical protein LZ31DRAFT_339409 [Colletotrichum somersetense]|nr:hypothetical protein LZ31DRAFT_339409 [Colletotrichum somersetense]